MASVRAVRNLGYAAGGLAATAALAVGGRPAFVTVVAANAAAYALCAWLYSKLPHVEAPVRAARRRVPALRDPWYVGLMLTSVVFALSLVLLQIGIPLWVAKRTDAPHALAGVVLAVNTLLVVLLQVRAAKGSETVAGATKLLRTSAVGFAVCCGPLRGGRQAGSGLGEHRDRRRRGCAHLGRDARIGGVVDGVVRARSGGPACRVLGRVLAQLRDRVHRGPDPDGHLVNSGLAGWGVLAALFLAAATAARLLVD